MPGNVSSTPAAVRRRDPSSELMLLSTIDLLPPEQCDALLVGALRDQIDFMVREVPFWRTRLAGASGSISELRDLARFPIFAKEELRSVSPAMLLPGDGREALAVCRWTSGTSGRPTFSGWTRSDWSALVQSTAQMLARHAPTSRPVAFNCYSQSHLTGGLYHASLQAIGGAVFDRSHHAEEQFPTLAQLALFEVDTLVLPEQATRGQGIGITDLPDADPAFLGDHGVRWWIGSSGTFSPPTIDRVRRAGVSAVSNLYGSSEVGLFAISCQRCPGDFHLSRGCVFVEVVDDEGKPVAPG